MDKLTQAAILAGINDDSFQKGWKTGEENQNRKKNLEQYEALRAKDPKAAISVSGAGNISVNPEDPLASYLRGAQLRDKEDDNYRLETKAVQDEANRLLGKSRDQIAAGKDIKALLKGGSNITSGALKPLLARYSGEVGALAEAEQNRALPNSLKGDASKLWNYLTGQTVDTLTDAQRAAVQQYIDEKDKSILGRMKQGREELHGRAPQLAPSLSRNKKLESVLESIGAGSGLDKELTEYAGPPQQTPPPAGPPAATASAPPAGAPVAPAAPGAGAMTPRQKRIAELKAKLGAQ